MAFPTSVNNQITDAVTQANVKVLGDAPAIAMGNLYQATAQALASATGVIRSEVGKQTGIKFTPTIAFVADAVPENAAHIEDLLRQARERDQEVAGIAADADFAGDPDPYKHPDDEDE